MEKNIVVTHENFRILEKGFNKLVDRRIAESLYVKDYQPKLNEQKDLLVSDIDKSMLFRVTVAGRVSQLTNQCINQEKKEWLALF